MWCHNEPQGRTLIFVTMDLWYHNGPTGMNTEVSWDDNFNFQFNVMFSPSIKDQVFIISKGSLAGSAKPLGEVFKKYEAKFGEQRKGAD